MFRTLALPVVAIAGLLYLAVPQSTQASPDPEIHIVKMIDISATEYTFEPASLTVKRGDIVRWVQTATSPHNVQFKAGSFGDAAMGPFLLAVDDTYELVVDDRFADGDNPYVCTPHEFMGMKGTITVAGE